MKILALDSCFNYGSAAISEGGKVLGEVEITKQFAQSSQLVVKIEELLKKTSLDYRDIDYIAATSGPGSFTGIRVTLATANAIAFSTSKKLIGINTLQAYAFQAGVKGEAAVVINAFRDQFYIQKFKDFMPLTEVEAIDYAEIGNYSGVIITDSKELLLGHLKQKTEVVEQKNINSGKLALLAEKLLEDGLKPVEFINPVYIRPPDAKVSTKAL